ncbi:hypothetical protein OKW21_006042 [Catalinimonas alkaloidigena]|uniref:hypothetical protein n=1 Tax=Catalinimonas alkaloidigena TaxID=1075417 RepID=UPI002405AC87|nr:hypothetical protein [Catalinimonas alkaloidigena]MDF9800779.1 hypothetical protein [Catalinimonas alkaloidigena]
MESIIINLSNIEQTVATETVNRNGLITLQTKSGADYFDLLVEKYHYNSATHSNFINLKKDLIAGEIVTNEKSGETLRFLNSNNINELIDKLSFDLSLFETAYIQVNWNIDRTKIVEFDFLDRTCVTPIESDEYGKVSRYAVTEKSLKKGYNKNKFKKYTTYPAFSTKGSQDENGEEEYTQILEIRRYSPGNPYITIPSYNSILNYVDIEKELSTFHLASISNGFFSSAIINVYGSPSEEQKKWFKDQFLNSFTGSHNTSKVVFNYSADEYRVEILPVQANNNPDLFQHLTDTTISKISTGHRSSQELAGISTKGSDLGGDANKLFIAYNLFKNNVTNSLQKLLIDGINKILSVNGLGTIDLKTELPIQLYPETLLQNLTQDERREMLFGLPPVPVSNQNNQPTTEQPTA